MAIPWNCSKGLTIHRRNGHNRWPDELIYLGTSYPKTHLVSFNPKTKEMKDYGQLDPREESFNTSPSIVPIGHMQVLALPGGTLLLTIQRLVIDVRLLLKQSVSLELLRSLPERMVWYMAMLVSSGSVCSKEKEKKFRGRKYHPQPRANYRIWANSWILP